MILDSGERTEFISIHAPREGSDATFLGSSRSSSNFNPRPPRGERRPVPPWNSVRYIHFNPRPPRGERPPLL